MPLADHLYLAADLMPQQTLEVIFGGSTPIVHVEYPAQDEYFAGTFYSGFHIDARNVNPRPLVTHPQDVLGFQPTIEIIFTPEKDTDVKEMRDWMIRTTMDLIRHMQWNAGMIFNDSTIVALKYRDGELILNQLFNIWTPDRLSLVNLPYIFKEMPRV